MSQRSVPSQPGELRDLHYRQIPLEDFRWFELSTPGGDVYAKVGMAKRGDAAWLYWRIIAPSMVAWREFKRIDVPWFKRVCGTIGARIIFVATHDPHDVQFDKMVSFMDFTVEHFAGVKIGWQLVEGV